LAVRPVLLVAAALFVLEMALSGRYGFQETTCTFLDSARHLQGGYVDQPILVTLLARASLSLLGVCLPGLRLWSALAVAATAITIAGFFALEFGGRRTAQVLAALASATMRPSSARATSWKPRPSTSCSGRRSRWS
jgi:4-amino-4-deoxy-L-arabinose transferase-like glycosyltransferase